MDWFLYDNDPDHERVKLTVVLSICFILWLFYFTHNRWQRNDCLLVGIVAQQILQSTKTREKKGIFSLLLSDDSKKNPSHHLHNHVGESPLTLNSQLAFNCPKLTIETLE